VHFFTLFVWKNPALSGEYTRQWGGGGQLAQLRQ
jgi:hypothetical protein